MHKSTQSYLFTSFKILKCHTFTTIIFQIVACSNLDHGLRKIQKILSTLGFTVFFNLIFIVVNKTSEKLENLV